MADDESTPSDRLYGAIKSLSGWYYVLDDAEDEYERPRSGRMTGQIVSSILLAGGESSIPIAVNGELDDTRSGYLVIVYDDRIVKVEAVDLGGNAASYTTRVRFFAGISDLRLSTRHSFYDGIGTHARTRGFEFSFMMDGEPVRLEPTNWAAARSPLVGEEAMYAAYLVISNAKATA